MLFFFFNIERHLAKAIVILSLNLKTIEDSESLQILLIPYTTTWESILHDFSWMIIDPQL